MGAPYSRPCAISARRTRACTAEQWGDRGGRRSLPKPVSTCFQVRGARGKPRIARVGVALGAGARRDAAPPPSRRRQRGRACAVAEARHCSSDRKGARDASVLEAARGAKLRAPAPPAGGAASACPPPLRPGARGCRPSGVGGHRGARHWPPACAHTRSVDGRDPPAKGRCTGGGRQGRACLTSGRAPRRLGAVTTPAAARPLAARRRANAGGGGGARWQAAAAAISGAAAAGR